MIDFIEEPDGVGMGRVIFAGRYYCLPAALVSYFAKLYRERPTQTSPSSPSNATPK